jgi:L-ascorbate metabolism protein UlaG (beta-lactamase superfamily)
MSEHFDGRRFFNPGIASHSCLWRVMFWLLTRRRGWPRWIDSPQGSAPPPLGGLTATFVNHSTFLLGLSGVGVLTDPIWANRAGPFSWLGPHRVRRPGLAFTALPPIELVLLSHNHYDHCNLDTLRRLRAEHDPLFVTGLGIGRWLVRRGFTRVVELGWWQSHRHGALDVTMTPAQHFSRRGLFDADRTLWGGFVVRGPAGTVFFAGDTGYARHFTDIRERLGPPDLALLPIGAYEPRWLMQAPHMNPHEAVQAHLDLNAGLSLGMHFGTFELTDEPIDEPEQELRRIVLEQNLLGRFLVPGFGETMILREEAPATPAPGSAHTDHRRDSAAGPSGR